MELLMDILGIQVKYKKWSGQDSLPLYITGNYEFQTIVLNGGRCILLTPKDEIATVPALKKQIKRIREIDNVPVVLKLATVSSYRRKSLIENRIPFITNKQVYLPFMGTYLQNENQEMKEIKKFMFSTQQLILLYLYSRKDKFYISDATNTLPFSAMTMSRAVKQIEMTDLFDVSKDGVNKVIESKYDRQELFERIKTYLTSPVRVVGYIEKKNITNDMVFAGESALAERTMLNPSRVATYAVEAKLFDKSKLMDELVDPDEQIRLELWAYNPKQFGEAGVADILSVVLSLKDNADERIEEAIEELLESTWRE